MAEIDTSAEAVARMLDGVTPGPWVQGKTNPERVSRSGRYIANCDPLHSGKPMTEANARFIAWARDAVPALAAERDTAIMQRDEARAQVARWQRQSAESWAAFSAMRNHINEHLPMRSAEADLINGPEFSVSCENVASDVIAALAAERDRLAAENARLQMMLAARGRLDAGELSNPPTTGIAATPLVPDWRTMSTKTEDGYNG